MSEKEYFNVADIRQRSSEKLSSGYKINRAADDAAVVALSTDKERM